MDFTNVNPMQAQQDQQKRMMMAQMLRGQSQGMQPGWGQGLMQGVSNGMMLGNMMQQKPPMTQPPAPITNAVNMP